MTSGTVLFELAHSHLVLKLNKILDVDRSLGTLLHLPRYEDCLSFCVPLLEELLSCGEVWVVQSAYPHSTFGCQHVSRCLAVYYNTNINGETGGLNIKFRLYLD